LICSADFNFGFPFTKSIYFDLIACKSSKSKMISLESLLNNENKSSMVLTAALFRNENWLIVKSNLITGVLASFNFSSFAGFFPPSSGKVVGISGSSIRQPSKLASFSSRFSHQLLLIL